MACPAAQTSLGPVAPVTPEKSLRPTAEPEEEEEEDGSDLSSDASESDSEDGGATSLPAVAAATAGTPAPVSAPLAMVFLLDGSGSVGDDDFANMTQFISDAMSAVHDATGGQALVSVLQFSSDVQVELTLAQHPLQEMQDIARSLVRTLSLEG